MASGDDVEVLDADSISGIIPLIMDELRTEMNLTWLLHRRVDRKWGSLNADGKSIDGMFSSLVKGDADIAAASLTMLKHRQKFGNFLVR